jgi:hypothetical protein
METIEKKGPILTNRAFAFPGLNIAKKCEIGRIFARI